MESSIIKRICSSCNCDELLAKEYLNDEIRNLRELEVLNDIRYSDLELACSNLGLENDYVEYFIQVLST